ncbi:PHP domain-containing protein [Eubacteriales bacterium OttesenSCG-928-G02]|nr:PHP domain-containing protein [Eubacteriales bacterium OttesenSCG-928-G02]
MKIYDLHVHTKLSSCASPEAELDEYIKVAEELGIELIGFTDHAWDSKVPGASPWYQAQDYPRLFERKPSYKSDKVKVLFGAEGEFASFKLAVTRDTIKKLDYIIIPHSHIHMKGLVLPEGWESNALVAKYLVESFISLCSHPDSDLIFGIAHPFYPLGKFQKDIQEIMDLITEEQLKECFELANRKNIRIELNLSCFKDADISDMDSYPYAKILKAAGKAGCKLFIGSDSHKVYDKTDPIILKAPEYIKSLGLNEAAFEL